jgi:hypothetical protein
MPALVASGIAPGPCRDIISAYFLRPVALSWSRPTDRQWLLSHQDKSQGTRYQAGGPGRPGSIVTVQCESGVCVHGALAPVETLPSCRKVLWSTIERICQGRGAKQTVVHTV